jgi:hypothetical protein
MGGFNHGASQEQHRLFHGRGCMYGGYARAWQRHHPRGYRYSGTRFDLNQGGVGSSRSVAQPNQATLSQAPPRGYVNQDNATQVETSASTQGQGGPTQLEAPHVPGVFKAQKPGKAKVDEGSAGEKEKPFCFLCYKPGHGKLECIAKLLCDICGSREHLTGKYPILK